MGRKETMLHQLLEGASYKFAAIGRRKEGQTKSFSTAVCRVLLFTASHFCMAILQNAASTSIFNSSQQGKWDHKCHAQTIMFGGHYTGNWLIMRRQAGCYDNTYHYQPSLICKIQCLWISFDWYTGHQKLHISRQGLRAVVAISCQREAILHWICWSHKYSLRESL